MLVALHLSSMLDLPLKYPVIFNAHKSSIVNPLKNSRPLPLYFSYNTKDTLDEAIRLLSRNLRNIWRTFERLKDRDEFGRVEGGDKIEEPKFPNFLLLLLYRIAEFQVY